jgi:hypothetical protein
MADAELPTLLAAVRRRLWRAHFVTAARAALAGSAGLMLLAVAVHLVARAVPLGAVLSAAAGLWVAALGWATAQRPNSARCALWADRHLGGASAYTTWFEQQQAGPPADAQALRRLEQWTQARVPISLRLLAEQPAPARLTRPLLALAVCGALAAAVLTLPSLAPDQHRPAAAPTVGGSAGPAAPLAEAPVPAELVDDIARALRAAAPGAEAERGQGGQGGAAAAGRPGRPDDAATAAAGPRAGGTPVLDKAAAARPAPPGAPQADSAGAGGLQAGGAGAGREAGSSRDERADVGVSRAPRAAIPVPRSVPERLPAAADRRADADQQGHYGDDPALQAPAPPTFGPAAAAATPPAAADAARLTPTETGYVQAWMKANAQRP